MARERKTAGVMSCFEIRDARSPGPFEESGGWIRNARSLGSGSCPVLVDSGLEACCGWASIQDGNLCVLNTAD